MKDKIEIELSKSKLLLLLIACIVFVVMGVLFIAMPDTFTFSRIRSTTLIIAIGITSSAFFGICLVFIFKKMFDTRIGITIDENGIDDNSSGTSIGLIEWDDIIGTKVVKIASTKLLMIETRNADKYISRATNILAKKAMQANNKSYGSPISISTTALKIGFEELEELINAEVSERRTT